MQIPAPNSLDCYALLDDCEANPSHPSSRLYTAYAGSLRCDRLEDLGNTLDEMSRSLGKGLYAVGLFAYELGEALHDIEPRSQKPIAPLAQILLFGHCRRMQAAEVQVWLAEYGSQPAGVANVKADVDEAGFREAVSRIHGYIEAGDTYQVDCTYRLRSDAYGPPHALYARLRERQAVPFGALIGLPDGGAVLSLSPELFVRHEQGKLTARPMKGTAQAAADPEENAARARALAADPKNRAENLMIVDLLRNDLGRTAETGSVETPRMFEVSRHGEVLQMTSTITAQAQADASLYDMLVALFPCGSVTGAPKRRTMEIIRELEAAPRGLYTGAIGWFDAPQDGRGVGDFCLSVPIRTLTLEPPLGGVRKACMGVGAGIVHDSDAAAEYDECRLKASFLTGLPHRFQLIETIHANRTEGCRHLDQHMKRLAASAAYFGFVFNEALIREKLGEACNLLGSAGAHRFRISLAPSGDISLQFGPVAPVDTPVRLMLAREPIRSDDLFLRHKTTLRGIYDRAWAEAEAQGAFDMLFFNERGELTEGARSSIFLRIEGNWYTPPLSSGLLPGVMRSSILADPASNAVEKVLRLDDLRSAEALVACNVLRGALPAFIEWQADPH